MRRKAIWVQAPPLGWVLYDADCGFCTRWAWHLARFVGPRGYHLAPLQAPWVRQRLALSEEELLCEMRVLTAGDALYGGRRICVSGAAGVVGLAVCSGGEAAWRDPPAPRRLPLGGAQPPSVFLRLCAAGRLRSASPVLHSPAFSSWGMTAALGHPSHHCAVRRLLVAPASSRPDGLCLRPLSRSPRRTRLYK